MSHIEAPNSSKKTMRATLFIISCLCVAGCDLGASQEQAPNGAADTQEASRIADVAYEHLGQQGVRSFLVAGENQRTRSGGGDRIVVSGDTLHVVFPLDLEYDIEENTSISVQKYAVVSTLPTDGPNGDYEPVETRIAEAVSAKGFPQWTSTSFVDLWDDDDVVDVIWQEPSAFSRESESADIRYHTLPFDEAHSFLAVSSSPTQSGRLPSDVECLVRDTFVNGQHVSREIIRCYTVCNDAISCGGSGGDSGSGDGPGPDTPDDEEPYIWDMEVGSDITASLVRTRIFSESACESMAIDTPEPYDGVAVYNVFPSAYTRIVDISFPAGLVTYQDSEVSSEARWNNSLMWSGSNDGFRATSVSGAYSYEHDMSRVSYHYVLSTHRGLAAIAGIGDDRTDTSDDNIGFDKWLCNRNNF